MQVQKIQSNNPAFGYNAAANKELIEILNGAKKNKAYTNFLRELCLSTNKAENQLVDAEKKNKKTLQTMLIASFVPIKILYTEMIDSLFPKLNYRHREMESYADEINKKNIAQEHPEHWMNMLYSAMKEHEDQEKAEDMANQLSYMMSQMFPDTQFDFSNLTGLIRENYLEEADSAEEIDDEGLSKRISLGKEKVIHYEPITELEKSGFASLGGMKELKEMLNKELIVPLKDPVQAKYNEEHYGLKRPNGILFYGPPGCGKTTIVERLSVETGLPLLELTTDSYGSQYINGSEINIGAVFDYASSIATEEKPVILFIDDVDTIIGSRDSGMHDHKKSEMGVFLKRIQDAQKNNIIVMCATNSYDNIDKAVLRRLRKQMYVGLPDFEGRKSILKLMLEKTDNGKKLASDDAALDKIAKMTEGGFPISALEDFVNDAREKSVIDFYNVREITLKDFEEILAKQENQNKKIKEDNYKTKITRKSVGF